MGDTVIFKVVKLTVAIEVLKISSILMMASKLMREIPAERAGPLGARVLL